MDKNISDGNKLAVKRNPELKRSEKETIIICHLRIFYRLLFALGIPDYLIS